jgi:ABC-type transporter Mla maintaining outer membrane lipid asymmetry ATPase subunit MlaF
MHNAFRIADRLILLKDAHILAEGTPEDFYKSNDEFVQRFLNVCEV